MVKTPAGAARKAAKRERKAAEKAAAASANGAAEDKQAAGGKQSSEQPQRKRPRQSNGATEANGGEKAAKMHRQPAAKGPTPVKAIPPTHVQQPASAEADDSGVYEVFVKYLPRDCDEAEATALFSKCGVLAKPIALLRDFSTGLPKGAGFVTFETAAGAAAALKLNGHPLRGRHLEVTTAVCRRERPGLRGQQQALGTHTPALLGEILSLMVSPDKEGCFVDATFGRGGHSRAILKSLGPGGRLHGLDMDPQAVEVGTALAAADSRFSMHATVFGDMRKKLPKALRGCLAGVLFDLGISSPQLDDPSRGMRPEQSGPLDLRFDISAGEPAWRLLETASREELAALLARYGDGQDAASAARVADAVALAKLSKAGVPRTTAEFAALVAACRIGGDYQPMHAAKLTFQALRMALNGERKQMMRGMKAAFKMLRPGGVIAVISWKHSEALLLTEFLREHELAPESFPLREWWEAPEHGHEPLPRSMGLRRAPAVRPGAAELRENARSRSAVLHILYKEEGVRVADVEAAVHAKLGWDTLSVPWMHSV